MVLIFAGDNNFIDVAVELDPEVRTLLGPAVMCMPLVLHGKSGTAHDVKYIVIHLVR